MFWLMMVTAYAAPGDLDDDGILDADDNCPQLANTDQTDADQDGWGDACVEPGAYVHPSASLGRNARVLGSSVVMDNAVIGDASTVIDAIVGEQSAGCKRSVVSKK